MRPYVAVLSARLRMLLQYRAAAVAGMSTQIFWGWIRVMIFGAFYASTVDPQPMSYAEVVDYVWLGQALLMLIPIWVDQDIRGLVRQGTVAYELVRPLDLYAYWYARSVASRLAPALLRAVPIIALALLFFDLRPPASAAAASAWVATTLGALLLASAINALLGITLLWTVAGEGVSHLASAIVFLLSGIIVPLPLYPDWIRTALEYTPFAGLLDLPFRLYCGHLPADEVWRVLALQLGWTLVLVLLGRLLLRVGTRRLVVQGG